MILSYPENASSLGNNASSGERIPSGGALTPPSWLRSLGILCRSYPAAQRIKVAYGNTTTPIRIRGANPGTFQQKNARIPARDESVCSRVTTLITHLKGLSTGNHHCRSRITGEIRASLPGPPMKALQPPAQEGFSTRVLCARLPPYPGSLNRLPCLLFSIIALSIQYYANPGSMSSRTRHYIRFVPVLTISCTGTILTTCGMIRFSVGLGVMHHRWVLP